MIFFMDKYNLIKIFNTCCNTEALYSLLQQLLYTIKRNNAVSKHLLLPLTILSYLNNFYKK